MLGWPSFDSGMTSFRRNLPFMEDTHRPRLVIEGNALNALKDILLASKCAKAVDG